MMDQLRAELERSWKYYEKHSELPRVIKYCWTDPRRIPQLGDGHEELPAKTFRNSCNKLTCFYWTINSQLNYGLQRSNLVIMGILKEWYRCYNDDPKTDNSFFFGTPALIKPDGPTTVDGILDIHRAFCKKASLSIEKLRSRRPDDGLGGWIDIRPYHLHPLFRAIIIIHHESLSEEGVHAIVHGGIIHLVEYLEAQTVLLVRTGDESGLSGPISFEGISDGAADNMEVRVSLGTAVKFMADLEKREEAFSTPKVRVLSPEEGGPETRQIYAARTLRLAMKVGIDNVQATAISIYRIKAKQLGLSFYDLEPEELSRKMK